MPTRSDFQKGKAGTDAFNKAMDAYNQSILGASQADQLRAQAEKATQDAEAGRLMAQTDAQNAQTTEATRKSNELQAYQNSPLGETMTIAKSGPSFAAGGVAGALEGHYMGKMLKSAVPSGVSYSVSPIARALMGATALGMGGIGYLKGHEFGEQSQDSRNSPLGSDIGQTSQNFLYGQGLGAASHLGAQAAFGNAAQPVEAAPEAPPLPGPSEPPAPPKGPALESGMRHGKAVDTIADYLGADKGKSKAETFKNLTQKYGAAGDSEIRGLASALNDRGFNIDAGAESKTLRKGVLDALKGIGTSRGSLASLAGALGLYGLSSSDTAEAGGLPTDGPARDESLTPYNLHKYGLPASPGEAADAGAYLVPYLGEARLAGDVGSGAGRIARALMGGPESVMGPQGDPRVTAFHNWLAGQRGELPSAAGDNMAIPGEAARYQAIARALQSQNSAGGTY